MLLTRLTQKVEQFFFPQSEQLRELRKQQVVSMEKFRTAICNVQKTLLEPGNEVVFELFCKHQNKHQGKNGQK